jgi:hypothetical protein
MPSELCPHPSRVSRAAVAYFACGFIMFAALPAMKTEFLKYPNDYRSKSIIVICGYFSR